MINTLILKLPCTHCVYIDTMIILRILEFWNRDTANLSIHYLLLLISISFHFQITDPNKLDELTLNRK